MIEKHSKRKFIYSFGKFAMGGAAVYYGCGLVGGFLAASYEPSMQSYMPQDTPTRFLIGSILGSKVPVVSYIGIYSFAKVRKLIKSKKDSELERIANDLDSR